jgi:hypothetical protein
MFEKRSSVYRERRNGTVFGYSYRSWRLDYILHVRDVLCKYAIHSKVSRIVLIRLGIFSCKILQAFQYGYLDKHASSPCSCSMYAILRDLDKVPAARYYVE